MAIMFPDPLPGYIEQDPLRRAECRVYYDLKNQLSDDFYVFYSRPWLGLEPDGREVDGETDFTVAHQEFGILTIEVKGGRISRNGQTDKWTSKDRHDVVHNIKNPVLQASRGKYHLLKKLNQSLLWKPCFINAHHGVVFPDSSQPDNNSDLGADMPLHIFTFGESMKWLGSWVENRMAIPGVEATKRRVSPLGNDGLNAIEQLLASSFQLRTNLGAAFSSAEQKIILLTEEQFHVLDDLEHYKRLAISGAAGTGKTLLALEKAKRLAASGLETLFTCYNRNLAAYLSNLIRDAPKLSVASFHQFCGTTAKQAEIIIPDENETDGSVFYSKILPEALIDSLAKVPEFRFDAIIVDEGQDFLPEWWDALQLTLKDEDKGVMYVFYDDNQRVYGHKSRIAPGIPQLSYRLTRNLRNTKEIFTTAVPWYQGGITRSAGPNGEDVKWNIANSKIDVINRTKSFIGDLIQNEKVPIEDIGVICSTTESANDFITRGKLGRYQACSAESPKKDQVVIDTIRRFKGLERNVIILPLFEPLTESELIYVALSRAKLYLAVIGTQECLDILRR